MQSGASRAKTVFADICKFERGNRFRLTQFQPANSSEMEKVELRSTRFQSVARSLSSVVQFSKPVVEKRLAMVARQVFDREASDERLLGSVGVRPRQRRELVH